MNNAILQDLTPLLCSLLCFVDQVKDELGIQAKHRQVTADDEAYTLRESAQPYMGYFGKENGALRGNNTISWQTIAGIT